jgi:hypothetical protein
MVRTIVIIIFLFLGGIFSASAQEFDTTIKAEEGSNHRFFDGEKIVNPSKITLVAKNGKITTLEKFMKRGDMQDYQHVVKDLDSDGKKELVIYDYTGGAHCCDEIYIFRNIGASKYQQVNKLFGGHTYITDQNEFEFGFFEAFGYFFTCYACGYVDSTDAGPIPMQVVKLKYSKNKLNVIQGDRELKSIINDNLAKLSEQPYQKLDDDLAMDEGLRKEFAMNLAVYYYSFGKNIVATKTVFNTYYKFPDAAKVWSAFVKNLAELRADNDF